MREPGAELDELARKVIGAAIEVHRTLGPGFLERVYEGALAVELERRRIPFVRQQAIGVSYKGVSVGEGVVDLWVDGRLIVELKTVENILPVHMAQVMSYLKATQCALGLLFNFNTHVLKDGGIRRIVLSS